jgi:ribA/ribD-fused uncharacterized protein
MYFAVNVTPAMILFWAKDSIFSNFFGHANGHPVIVTEDHSFLTNEHYYQWRKAVLFGDFDIAEQILAEKSPLKTKHLGRKVSGFNKETWGHVMRGVMIDGLMMKFGQNLGLRRELGETGDEELAEASPYDLIWGIGVGKDDPRAMDERQWLGANLLGQCLCEVRSVLR